jgi:hypothetical protein
MFLRVGIRSYHIAITRDNTTITVRERAEQQHIVLTAGATVNFTANIDIKRKQ